MQLYLFLPIAIIGALYAVSFARWLHKQGNIAGAYGVGCIVVIGVVLPLLRVLNISLW
jgi:hypothetical protein